VIFNHDREMLTLLLLHVY